MPAPKRQFSRPSIDLGGPKKDWQEVEVATLSKGDVVRGHGAVEVITLDDVDTFDRDTVWIQWQNGTISGFDPSDVVTAFTAV